MIGIARWYQRVKNAIHAVQALIIFIAWAIAIALFTQKARKDGRVYYYFALCWASIPALTYQTATPVFSRTKRFSKAYAHAIVDALFLILWFAAMIAMAVWVKESSHTKQWTNGSSKLGLAAWVLALIICLLFANTTAFSMWGAKYYRKNGELPSYEIKDTEPLPVKDRTNYSFIPNPNDKLGEYDPTHPEPGDEESTALRTNNTAITAAHLAVPTTSPTQGGFSPIDTSYHGGGSFYDQPPQPSHRFSSPRYETLHSNESDYIGGMELKPLPLDIRRR